MPHACFERTHVLIEHMSDTCMVCFHKTHYECHLHSITLSFDRTHHKCRMHDIICFDGTFYYVLIEYIISGTCIA